MTASRAVQVHTIKVSLLYMKPPVWRRLLVPSDTTLAELHHVIQDAMGWFDCHLHQFDVNGMDYAATEHMLDDTADESRVTLANLRLQVGDRFLYWYDFGDDWYHDIRVESVDRADPSLVYPRCVTGRRACPPEDCGGPGGFDELVAALANKDHPEHEMYSEWMETIGQVDYDPARFELAGINELLAHRSTGARQGQPQQ